MRGKSALLASLILLVQLKYQLVLGVSYEWLKGLCMQEYLFLILALLIAPEPTQVHLLA